MFKLLSFCAGLAFLSTILLGTWPIFLGQTPVDPLIEIDQVEAVKDDIADWLKDLDLDR